MPESEAPAVDSQTTRTGMSGGGPGYLNPIKPIQMPDMELSRAGQSSVSSAGSTVRWGVSGNGGVSNYFRPPSMMNIRRSPAIVPKTDPSLKMLSAPPTRFGEQPELSLARPSTPIPLLPDVETLEAKKKKEKEAQKAKLEAKAQQAFEQQVGDLLGRSTPFTQKDYEDFRDFIAQQQERLDSTNMEATQFRTKAREAFKTYQESDNSPQNAKNKEAYRRFLLAEEMQGLIPTPRLEPGVSH